MGRPNYKPPGPGFAGMDKARHLEVSAQGGRGRQSRTPKRQAPTTDLAELQERYDFVLAACRDAQDMASRYGWALHEIVSMDPQGQRADDLGRAARVARDALLNRTPGVLEVPRG